MREIGLAAHRVRSVMQASEPQSILTPLTEAAIFLTLTMGDGGEDAVRDLLAERLTGRLVGQAQVVDEVHGFRSFDERDLLGFVDGTENPEGEAASDAILIGDEDAAFEGGSYLVVQRYVHDLDAWDALSVDE